VSAESSLELIPGDGVDVCMCVTVRLPPVGCGPIELVCREEDLLPIRALGDHEFLLDSLEPILCVHGVFGLREGGGASSQELCQMRLVRWWRWGYLLLIGFYVVEGLQHGLHKLSLGGEQLLQVSVVVVDVVVVVAAAGLAIALAVPGVHHLMVWERGKNDIPRNPTICTRDMGKCCHLIYLNIDEVVDKVLKHPTTLTNTHKQNINHQTSDD
jgi:hypothetical protein